MKIRKFKSSDSVEAARLNSITIRHINKTDYSPKQIEIWSGRASAKRFRESMHQRKRFVAIEKFKIVGFGDYSLDGELTGLYVHRDFQGKDVGKILLKKLEEQAKKDKIKEFHLSSTITAKKFYEKNGYKIIKKGKHEIDGQKLVIYRMKKKLL